MSQQRGQHSILGCVPCLYHRRTTYLPSITKYLPTRMADSNRCIKHNFQLLYLLRCICFAEILTEGFKRQTVGPMQSLSFATRAVGQLLVYDRIASAPARCFSESFARSMYNRSILQKTLRNVLWAQKQCGLKRIVVVLISIQPF